MAENRRILVTGGAGFIGSHVAEAYVALGDEVWVLDDLSRGKRENVPVGAHFVQMDICDAAVSALFHEARFTQVCHHAAQIDVRVSVADPALDARINTLGLLNLLEASRATGVRRVIYVSSGGVVYGEPDERPTPESAPKCPLSPYGVSKLTGELYLRYYGHVHGLEYVALRYSNVYGPRQDPHGEAGVVGIFISRLLAGEPLTVYGDGEQTRDYVYVGDVAAANLLASELPSTPAPDLDACAFNVGTGLETSVNQLAGMLEGIAGHRTGRRHAPARAGELIRSALRVDKLRALGWRTEVTLEEGLMKTFAYISGAGART